MEATIGVSCSLVQRNEKCTCGGSGVRLPVNITGPPPACGHGPCPHFHSRPDHGKLGDRCGHRYTGQRFGLSKHGSSPSDCLNEQLFSSITSPLRGPWQEHCLFRTWRTHQGLMEFPRKGNYSHLKQQPRWINIWRHT